MSWIGWLVLLGAFWAAGALLITVAKSFAAWYDESVREPRERRRLESQRAAPAKAPRGGEPASPARTLGGEPRRPATRPCSAPRAKTAPRTSRWNRWSAWLAGLFQSKGYDHWIAAALAETDPQAKLQYLAKALRIEPGYAPGWGLEGNVLMGMGRFEEALVCFDKSLALHPSAAIWHKKALCCRQLGRTDEALACVDLAWELRGPGDETLAHEIARLRQELRRERGGDAN